MERIAAGRGGVGDNQNSEREMTCLALSWLPGIFGRDIVHAPGTQLTKLAGGLRRGKCHDPIQDTTGLGWSATAELVGPRHQDLALMLNLDLCFIVRPPANGRTHRAAERRRVSVATTAS